MFRGAGLFPPLMGQDIFFGLFGGSSLGVFYSSVRDSSPIISLCCLDSSATRYTCSVIYTCALPLSTRWCRTTSPPSWWFLKPLFWGPIKLCAIFISYCRTFRCADYNALFDFFLVYSLTECSHLSDYGKWLCGDCNPVLILLVLNFPFTMLALAWIASIIMKSHIV